MAISLPDTITITSSDPTGQRCRFCDQPDCADPDDMDGWAQHLQQIHGYRIQSDEPTADRTPRTITLRLVGWSSRAKFQPTERVGVNDKRQQDYAGRRGTIVGWTAATSEYCVRFDEFPYVGWLMSDCLDKYVKRPA